MLTREVVEEAEFARDFPADPAGYLLRDVRGASDDRRDFPADPAGYLLYPTTRAVVAAEKTVFNLVPCDSTLKEWFALWLGARAGRARVREWHYLKVGEALFDSGEWGLAGDAGSGRLTPRPRAVSRSRAVRGGSVRARRP